MSEQMPSSSRFPQGIDENHTFCPWVALLTDTNVQRTAYYPEVQHAAPKHFHPLASYLINLRKHFLSGESVQMTRKVVESTTNQDVEVFLDTSDKDEAQKRECQHDCSSESNLPSQALNQKHVGSGSYLDIAFSKSQKSGLNALQKLLAGISPYREETKLRSPTSRIIRPLR
ncbi:hypothetical protein AC578_5190 [Pseudocercospora eumusae]|nr:hypothetical protein AC578_5190 [Pseudocercospora eumusae]